MLNARLNRAPVSRAGRVAATAALLLITTLAAGFSAAQGASLTGVVTDQLGHPIANTSLSLLDLTSNANHQVKADQNGRYEFTDLSSGDYTLTVETLGFKKVEERVVLTDASLQRDVQLQLGTVHETITVIDGPSMPMPEAKRAFIQKKENAAPQPCPTGGGCIVPPTKLTDKKPVFPDSQAGVGGVVTLTGIIDATGHVSNLQVAGTANPDLAQAAIAAVTQWEFLPTRLDGQVVDTQIQISVAFKSTK